MKTLKLRPVRYKTIRYNTPLFSHYGESRKVNYDRFCDICDPLQTISKSRKQIRKCGLYWKLQDETKIGQDQAGILKA